MSKRFVGRLALALAFGLAVLFLPFLLTQSVGAGADLSGKLGLAGGVSAGTFAILFLAGVLTYVAAHRSPVLGFWMLFSYAIGLGVLFFLLGATSLQLPRSGAWMETVKSILGVALIAAAAGLVLPFLPKTSLLSWPSKTVATVAGVVAFAAVLAGALSLSFHGAAREKAFKAGALVVLLGALGLRRGWLGAPSDAA